MTFAELFKKYRLLSQFKTLTSFSDVLRAEGLTYDPSILSHWQSGNRTPSDRRLILILISIFIQNNGLKLIEEANQLLESTNQGYLTTSETLQLFAGKTVSNIFQVPRDNNFFIGRIEYLSQIIHKLKGSVILLHGISGSGKTTLSIRIANTCKSLFPDGIIWLRLDTLSIDEALNHISSSFGNDITQVKNLHSKAALIRSHLSNKQILIILDNVTSYQNIELLFPNTEKSSVIITSTYRNNSQLIEQSTSFLIEPFSIDESLSLFAAILGQEYIDLHKNTLLKISKTVGYLPLAINLTAQQLKNHKFTPTGLLVFLKNGNMSLSRYEYGGENLFKTIQLAIDKISPELKKILLSLGLFCDEDFSIESVAKIHKKSLTTIKEILEEFIDQSLIQRAANNRYKMHPLITQYCQSLSEVNHKEFLQSLAEYYNDFINEKINYLSLRYQIVSEINIITLLLKQCILEGMYKEIIPVWRSFSVFLRESGRWQLLDEYGDRMVAICLEIEDLHSAAHLMIKERTWFDLWRGKKELALATIKEGLSIAQMLDDHHLVSCAGQMLDVVLTSDDLTNES